MSACEDCKFAKWKLTETGRKHPDRTGRCTWSKTVRVAASVYVAGYNKPIGDPITLTGGSIERGNIPYLARCDVFERMPK